jgi:hypothetical protein
MAHDSIKSFRKSVCLSGSGESARVYFCMNPDEGTLSFGIDDLDGLLQGQVAEIPGKVRNGEEKFFSLNKLAPVEGILKKNLPRFRSLTA